MHFGRTWDTKTKSSPHRDAYIHYIRLKERIHDVLNARKEHVANAVSRFWTALLIEIEKANAHTAAERARIGWTRESKLVSVCDADAEDGKQLVAFVELNQTALRKIVKKMLKQTKSLEGARKAKLPPLPPIEPPFVVRAASGRGLGLTLLSAEVSPGKPQYSLPNISVDYLGHGAFARVVILKRIANVYCLRQGSDNADDAWSPRRASAAASSAGATCDEPRADVVVKSENLAVKIGRWKSLRRFENEVKLQQAAAEAGVAPRIFFSESEPAPRQMTAGVIGMERLTGPTLFRWMVWISKDYKRAKHSSGGYGGWLIDPAVAKIPLVKAWLAESQRLRRVLSKVGIDHGDVHERNFIFDVPPDCISNPGSPRSSNAESEADDASERGDDDAHELPEMSAEVSAADASATLMEQKRTKRRMMAEIAKGPAPNGGSRARLLLIDYGRATAVTSLAQRLAVAVFGGGRRLVDPEEEPPSPKTPNASRGPSPNR